MSTNTQTRDAARNTPAGQLLARMGLDWWEVESSARRVAEHAAAEIERLLAPKEEERQRQLGKVIAALRQAPAERKALMNFPRSIIRKDMVPLSIVVNRLGALAAFRGMDVYERTEWVRENLDAVGCTRITAEEARARHGCGAELVGVDEE